MLGTMKWRAFSPEEIPDVALNLATLLRRLGLPVDDPEPCRTSSCSTTECAARPVRR